MALGWCLLLLGFLEHLPDNVDRAAEKVVASNDCRTFPKRHASIHVRLGWMGGEGKMERRQKATETDDQYWALSTPQEAAADLLAGGATITTAERVGVARQTVSEWRNQHPGFQAALNRRREELMAIAERPASHFAAQGSELAGKRYRDRQRQRRGCPVEGSWSARPKTARRTDNGRRREQRIARKGKQATEQGSFCLNRLFTGNPDDDRATGTIESSALAASRSWWSVM
jgi:hypothetical protein